MIYQGMLYCLDLSHIYLHLHVNAAPVRQTKISLLQSKSTFSCLRWFLQDIFNAYYNKQCFYHNYDNRGSGASHTGKIMSRRKRCFYTFVTWLILYTAFIRCPLLAEQEESLACYSSSLRLITSLFTMLPWL